MKEAKKIIYYLVTYLPLTVLVLLTVCFCRGTISSATADPAAIYADMKAYLDAPKGEFLFHTNGGRVSFRYDHYRKDVSYKPSEASFDVSSPDGHELVYVFGSSPLVTKLFSSPKDGLFPSILEKKLSSGGKRYHVVNFGVVSFDSFEIKELIKAAVAARRPDMIIFYEGHMDYESAYMAAVKPPYYILRKGAYLWTLEQAAAHAPGWFYRAMIVADWYLRAAVEPNLLNFMQMVNILRISPGPFEEVNRLILGHYADNLEEIMDTASGVGTELVIVTPIANLEAKPFGIYGITEKYYRRALAEPNPVGKLHYFREARDSEIFTGDMRAKRGLYEFLRGISRPGVKVFDLDYELEQEGFTFDNDYFYDIGHMRPKLHEIVAEKLFRFLVREGLAG